MSQTRRFVDLHTHSTASDGATGPGDLIRLADAAGLAAVALTDHDTTAGIAEARAAATDLPDLHFIAGVEVSAVFSPGTLHILGLGIDESDPALLEMTAHFRHAREQRNPKIIQRLQAMGVGIDMDDVRAAAGAGADRPSRIISRLHIAQALASKGVAQSVAEAFDRYVGDGAPAYVPKDRMAPEQVIAAIRSAGGAAIAAHPAQMRCRSPEELQRVLRQLKDVGLAGVEVYHSDHTDVQTRQYLDLAYGLELLVTGGSDFHGPAKPHVRLGYPRTPLSIVAEPWASRWFPASGG